MSKRYIALAAGVLIILFLGLLVILFGSGSIAVLDPKGIIAAQQRDLIMTATILMLLIVIPVFILTGAIAWRYREGNHRAKYSPDLDGNRIAETIWWGFPLLIIAVLSVIIWNSSHDLDPRRPISSAEKPLQIQVVALRWKWLFMYPNQRVASVNYFQFPVGTPVDFQVTADAPMNSFWIPQLGGQIYAMAGMSTRLHLLASEAGSYRGSSANLSGEGFSSMQFEARATSKSDFDAWVKSTKSSSRTLSSEKYEQLVLPSKDNPRTEYAAYQSGLYDRIMMKYTPHGGHDETSGSH